MKTSIKVIECYDIPTTVVPNTIYRLLPKHFDQAFYDQRTNRNIGWVTQGEQQLLTKSVVGIAGCGGMGGQLAEKFLRLGVGEIRIADTEVFDISNLNRQFAAMHATIGKSKAWETARMLRDILEDVTLVVYPQGICEESVEGFLEGCDLVCDEIEFWAVGSRILLHQHARAQNVPLFCCNTIGFGSRLFFFTAESATMEECLCFTYEEAMALQIKVQTGTASAEEVRNVMEHAWRGLLPDFPEYCPNDEHFQNVSAVEERLIVEGKGAILATNPPLATGLIADRVLLYLLRDSGVKRDIAELPEMPGYLYIDVGKMEARVVKGKWW